LVEDVIKTIAGYFVSAEQWQSAIDQL